MREVILDIDPLIQLSKELAIVTKQRDYLLAAAKLTLDENGHLADGDVCTLAVLKIAVASVDASHD
jgi:hypothetical protein